LSDKPAQYDYSPQHHAQNLTALVQHLVLQDITLIVHDFGGVIGFDYALRFPDNIKRVVVLNSWLWSAVGEPSYEKMKPILRSPLLPILYRWFNFSPRYLLPQSFVHKRLLTPRLRKQYTKPFANANQRNGALAFARSLLHDQDWFESLWVQVGKLREKPALLVWGMQDKFVLPSYLEKMATAFLHTTIVRLENCGHFPQEEAKETFLEHLQAFLS
jgi:haloalkane dehalogenase